MTVYTLDALETCRSPLEALNTRIEVLAAMSGFLAGVLARCSNETLRHKPSAELFSVLEQVCHLRDIEIEGYTVRLERILAEHHPVLPDIDGSRLAIERRYNEEEVGPAFMAFRAAREKNLQRLRKLTMAELERKAVMDVAGEISLARLIAMWVAHDAGHRDELAACVSA